MRTPTRLVGDGGEVYYRVRYIRGGKQRALSFWGETAEADAGRFASLLTTLGPDSAVEWWNRQLDEGEVANGLTVDAWWDRYLRATTGLTDGTRTTYARNYARVWSPRIGAKPLAAVTREDIAVAVNQLSETKADKTVKNAYGIIASMFKAAVEEGLIPATPCRKIRMPRRTEHTTTEMRFLTYGEWERLRAELARPNPAINAPPPGHYVPLFTTLIGTGIRWGEAEALTVGDLLLDAYVELDDGSVEVVPQLRINKAAKWNSGKSTRDVGPTKTKRSNRTVALSADVVEILEPLTRNADGSPRKTNERLFLAPRGGPLRHPTVYAAWTPAVSRAGLEPRPRIHDLRHTHVAWLIARGIPLPVIQARLGHESIETTVNRYGHLMPDLQIQAARAAAITRPSVLTPRELT